MNQHTRLSAPLPFIDVAAQRRRLGSRIDDATVSLPFPLSTGSWTGYAFRARFRPAALGRPQVKAFREWLISQAAETRTWLARVAGSAAAARSLPKMFDLGDRQRA